GRARRSAWPRPRGRAGGGRLARSRQPQIRLPQPRRTRCRPKAACAFLPSRPAGDQTRSRPPSRTRLAGSSPTQRCDARRHSLALDFSWHSSPRTAWLQTGVPPEWILPVSVSIRKPEEGNNLKLFDRIGRRMILTQAGQILLGEAERILGDVELTIKRMESYSDMGRRPTIVACTRNAYDHWMSGVLARQRERAPRFGTLSAALGS